MDKIGIVVSHKNEMKLGWLGLFSTIMSAVVFYFMWEWFVAFRWIPVVTVLMELAISVFYLLRGKRQECLNAEGISVKSPFGKKEYSWSEVRRFAIVYGYSKQASFSVKNEKTVYILLSIGRFQQKLRLEYREDIEQCIRRFYGAPDHNQISESGK